MSLQNLAKRVSSHKMETAKTGVIDVSAFFEDEAGKALPAGTETLAFNKPSAVTLFQALEDAAGIKKMFRGLPNGLCNAIATLALCDALPNSGEGSGPMAVQYAVLAQENPDLFMFIQMRFLEEFPSVTRFLDAEKDAGEDLGTV